jgi:O-antigen/teichoic acid export membrane protein
MIKLAKKLNKGLYRYVLNTIWLFVEYTLRVIVARYLGPERFGIYSYVISFVALFSPIAKLGLDEIVIRNIVSDKNMAQTYLGTTFWLKAVSSTLILSFIIVFGQTSYIDKKVTIYLYIIAFSSIFQSFEVVDFFFQSQVNSKLVCICKIIQLSISSVLKVYLVYMNAPLIYFVFICLIDQFTLAISYIIVYLYSVKDHFFKSFGFQIAIDMLKDSWPLILSGMAIIVYMKVDQIMIKAIINDKAVGLYAAGIRIIEALYFVPVLITNSLFPAIINAKKQSESLFINRLRLLLLFMVWSNIIIIMPMVLQPEWIISLLFGNEYIESSIVLAVYAWLLIFISIGIVSSKWLLTENIQIFTLTRALFGMIVNIILNLTWIPKYGIQGAAYASLVSQICATYLGYLFSTKTIKIFILQTEALFPILSMYNYFFKKNNNY